VCKTPCCDLVFIHLYEMHGHKNQIYIPFVTCEMKTLTPKEICKFLQENHCRLVEHDITKPEPTQIRELYLCLVNIFTPGRRDEINHTLDQLRQTQPNFVRQQWQSKIVTK
jgi:hypothetical protein